MEKTQKKQAKKIKNVKKLQGLEEITEILEIILASGFIDEKPLSCLLVAPVSSGKTISVKQFQKNKNILITTDSTAFGILKEYGRKLEKREIRHIIIPDLLNALARKKTTQEQLILFINASSEDGLFPSYTYGLSLDKYIEPFGWVLCITTDGFESKRTFFKNIGFTSRFFVLKHRYTNEILETILDNIINEVNIKIPDIKMNIKNKKKIKGNIEVFKELSYISRLLCKEGESEILRVQKKLQVFLKSCAYLRGDKEVKKEDLDTLRRLLPYFS